MINIGNDCENIILDFKAQIEHAEKWFYVMRDINFIRYNVEDIYNTLPSAYFGYLNKYRSRTWHNLQKEIFVNGLHDCVFDRTETIINKKPRFNGHSSIYITTYKVKYKCQICGILFYENETTVDPLTTKRITLLNNAYFINPAWRY